MSIIKTILDPILEFFCGKLFKIWSEARYRKLIGSLKNDLKMYESIEELLEEIKADRIALKYMHNGGGSIIPGKTKFMSVILEKVTDNINSRKDDFQRVVVGDRYLSSVTNMLFDEDHMILKRTEDLPKSKLRDVYELDDVCTSIIAYIAANEDNIWYLSINFKDEVSLNKHTKDRINVCRTKIINILEQYFTLTNRA